jgi:hypothetical protein
VLNCAYIRDEGNIIKTVISILYFLVLTTSLNAQKEYKLVSTLRNADFNYEALNFIDTFSNRKDVFRPTEGSFTVYTFIATFKGLSHRYEQEHDFHDILIIKVDKDNLIKDAFQYTLEWADMPLSCDLYRAQSTGVTLLNDLSVERLNLQTVEDTDDARRRSKEKGVIKLK